MALVIVFLLGIANFAAHRAALSRGAALLGRLPPALRPLCGGASLLVEFILLAISMAMAARGVGGWVWGYGFYTGGNALAAWLILSGRL
jgi:hypothetical protein